MANITLQEMYDEWKKAANGIGTPSDSAQPDPTQAATIIAALKGQLERLGDLLEQMQGNGTGAMPVELTGRNVEYRGSVSVGIGATATILDNVDPKDRRIVFIGVQTGVGTTFDLQMRHHQSASGGTPYGQTSVMTGANGSNGMNISNNPIESPNYSLVITDKLNTGFTAKYIVKERA